MAYCTLEISRIYDKDIKQNFWSVNYQLRLLKESVESHDDAIVTFKFFLYLQFDTRITNLAF